MLRDAEGVRKAASIAEGVRYLPGYLAPGEAEALFQELLSGVAWQQESIRLFGRERRVPRLIAWQGDRGLDYRYSGVDHPADGWSPALRSLRERILRDCGERFDFLLLNRYRTGSDSMGWHRDDEAMAGTRIASVSLGAPRRFLFRPDGSPPSEALELEHGSLLLFDRHIPHALPKSRRVTGERINLTFRRLR